MFSPLNASRVIFPLLMLFISVCSSTAGATTVIMPPDEDMVVGARAIIRGRVISISSGFDAALGPCTYVALDVSETLKGKVTARRVVLKEQGGEFGGVGVVVHGAPQFRLGEDTLLYLDTWSDGSLRTHQMFLGKFAVIEDPVAGRLIVARGAINDDAVAVTAPTRGRSTNRLELEEYRRMVRNTLELNREKAARFEAASFGDTPLLMTPPGYRNDAGAGGLKVAFATINPGIAWFEAGSGRAVVFMTNPDGAPFPEIQDDLDSALNLWSTAPGSALRVVSGGITGQCSPISGMVLITFSNCEGRWPPSPNCSGVLAQTQSWYSTVSPRVINGKQFYKILHSQVAFNPYAYCFLESRCKLREVAAHEIGHALGLGHAGELNPADPTPAEADATMYPVVHFDARCASLRGDDVAGINFIYPGGAPGLAIVTGAPLPSTVMGSSFSQKMSAVGGVGPYTWALAPGSPDLPPGVRVQSDGQVVGGPAAAGRFTFTLQVTDATSLAAQKTAAVEVINAPLITKVQFKLKKRRLTVKAQGMSAGCRLMIDNVIVAASEAGTGYFKLKPVNLTPGTHGVRIITASGALSDPVFFRVD